MKRIFLENIKSGKTELDKENLHYLRKVLRCKENEEIHVFDGTQEARATFNCDYLYIGEILITNINEQPLKLAVAQIKQARFEWMIEKASEIGVTEIFILNTTRTNNEVRNFTRLKKIAIEAARQSGRITIPKIHQPISLKEFLQSAIHNQRDCQWTWGGILETPAQQRQGELYQGIIIGPEGGFDDEEIKALSENCNPINLGPNILRSETAAIVGLATIGFMKTSRQSLLSQE